MNHTAQSAEAAFLGGLDRLLQAKVEGFAGLVGIKVIDLATGQSLAVNDELTFAVASSIKIPLLIGMYRRARAGELDVAAPLTVDDRRQAGGSGILQLLDHPVTLAVEDVATLMINVSDNTATNILIDMVGMDYVNDYLDQLGLSAIRLRRKMMDGAAAARGDENTGTPAAAAELMRLLWAGKIVDRALSDQVLRLLRKPIRKSPVRLYLPPDVSVANKPGWLEGVSSEWALVELRRRPYVLCCVVNYGLADDVEGFVAELSRDVYGYFAVLDQSTRFGRRLPLDQLPVQVERSDKLT